MDRDVPNSEKKIIIVEWLQERKRRTMRKSYKNKDRNKRRETSKWMKIDINKGVKSVRGNGWL